MISVLLVDDEPDLLELGKIFLEQTGDFSVTTVESGALALHALPKGNFDAVVSDFMMPEMDGITLLQKIRSDSDIPFILFTGKGREEVVIDAINSGADFYLQKGGDPSAQFAELGHKIIRAVSRHKTEKALHESEALYRTVFEATGTGMMILEEDKTIAVVNRELERISGYQRSDIEGKIKWTQFVSPDDLDRMKKYHEKRRRDPASVPKNYEFTFIDRNGGCIATYITVEMVPGTTKSVVSLIDISKEKSALQELADSEEKFRALTESLLEGIYMVQDRRYVYVNPAFARLFGYPAEELLALEDATLIFAEEDRPRIHKAMEERLAGVRDHEHYISRGVRKDGTVITVTIHGSRTRLKGRPAIVGTVTKNGCLT